MSIRFNHLVTQKRVALRADKKTGSDARRGRMNTIIFTRPVNATPAAHRCEPKIQKVRGPAHATPVEHLLLSMQVMSVTRARYRWQSCADGGGSVLPSCKLLPIRTRTGIRRICADKGRCRSRKSLVSWSLRKSRACGLTAQENLIRNGIEHNFATAKVALSPRVAREYIVRAICT